MPKITSQNDQKQFKTPGDKTENDIYALAIKLHEANYGSFDECSKAVRETDCNEEASIKALQRNF